MWMNVAAEELSRASCEDGDRLLCCSYKACLNCCYLLQKCPQNYESVLQQQHFTFFLLFPSFLIDLGWDLPQEAS